MSVLFDIKIVFQCGTVYWFKAKGSYDVRIDTQSRKESCTCARFVRTGCKKTDCKHIKAGWKLLKALGKDKNYD